MHRSGWFMLYATLALLPLSWASPALAGALEDHQQALNLHRAGHPEAAVAILRSLHQQYPNERRYLFDLINALAASGKNEEALALQQKAGTRPPAYVLEALAAAARHQGHYALALDLYRHAASRTLGGTEVIGSIHPSPRDILYTLQPLTPSNA